MLDIRYHNAQMANSIKLGEYVLVHFLIMQQGSRLLRCSVEPLTQETNANYLLSIC